MPSPTSRHSSFAARVMTGSTIEVDTRLRVLVQTIALGELRLHVEIVNAFQVRATGIMGRVSPSGYHS